jgi:glutaminyl-tRNA synthetase
MIRTMSADTTKPVHPPTKPAAASPAGASAQRPPHFIEQIIEADNAARKWGVHADGTPKVHTRFPPEPNGYLHVGHAKSICLNFGLAKKYGGKFNLRFDDTNPVKEEQEYVDAIIADVKWLTGAFDAGSFDAGPHAGGLFYASDYFERMYGFAEELIRKGKAYVCELSAEEVASRRGSVGVPATSPFRDRPSEESLALFRDMRAGKFPNGSKTLRAKIDLASPNFNLRDPVMYRILHESHHNTGDTWCLYPMYDWAHGLEDSLEGVTHSICTLEFEDHRPLYDWYLDAINDGRGPGSPWGEKIHHPQQIEFAKLRPTYTIMSKRNLLKLVQDKVVDGWDDPRMPTLSGMRRRGYPAKAIRAFVEDVGVTKVESSIDVGRLENAVREHLNKTAPRTMAVLRPLKVVIENWPAGKVDELSYQVNPEDPSAGTITVPFTGELFIEREDFAEVPPKGFHRLSPGSEVRLRWGYFITCTGVEKNAAGEVTLVRATYDPQTRGGDAPNGPDGKPIKKVKATLHWLSAASGHSVEAEARLIERLFAAEEPGTRTGQALDDLNPKSREVVSARVDPRLAASAKVGDTFQFERLGYFCVDRDSKAGRLVFNRTVTLKDSFASEEKPKAAARTYTLDEAALDLKIKKDRMPELLERYGQIAGLSSREPRHLTLEELRALKEWVKKNPLPRV